MVRCFFLLFFALAGCSGPMKGEISSDCELCQPEDCPACSETTYSVIPYEMDSENPGDWAHDAQEAYGKWLTLDMQGSSFGLLKDVDLTAYFSTLIPYGLELERTRRLRFEDTKIYQEDDGKGVKWVRLMLSSQLILDVCESRFLLVDVVEGLLERLNSNPDILASFSHQPITADDLEIYIALDSFFVEYDNATFIAWISLIDGEVRMFDGAIKNFYKDFWNSRVEPYWKSREFVQISRAAEKELDKKYPRKRDRATGRLFDIK